jgi:hypothetical protein
MTTLYCAILFMSVRTKMWIICDIHRPNQFEQILFLMKIDVQQESEIDEKQSKHQTSNERIIPYIFSISINKYNKITIAI